MNWKEKIKWKLLIILLALVGILIVWCAGKAGERKRGAETQRLREQMIKENEWASAGAVYKAQNAEEGTAEDPAQKTQGETADDPAQETQGEVADHPAQEPQEEAQMQTGGEAGEGSSEESTEAAIRVLLMTDGFESYYHQKITLQFQGDYELQGKDRRTVKGGEVLELTPGSKEFQEGSLSLSPTGEENRIIVTSLSRGQGNPAYRGKLTVYEDENGLRMVNELPLEQYLYAVVPSEMPASYSEEALKAQAVCARTYACVQMEGSSLENLGAQVDDSVSYQVYQNSGEAEAASRAVDETKGEILLNHGQPINAYYFSTSHGRTSTDEVWEASVPSAYLQSVECSYDAQEPWYAWEVTVSAQTMLENARKLDSQVQTIQMPQILETGEGGAVLTLQYATDQGEKELHSEYDIRSLLAPRGAAITRQDGSEVQGGTLLPSAYFTLEEQTDEAGNFTGCRIRGGGYGHGVGMSQNGAKGMAESGKNYQEILTYFYKDVEIGNINEVLAD